MNFNVLKDKASEAAKNPFWQQVATAVIGSVAAIGIGGFIDKIMDSLREKKIRSKSSEYFEKMLSAHPQLKNYEPEIVAEYWASLYHFAPFMAQDPLAAGAYIRQSLERGHQSVFGGPPPDVINTLTSINKSLVDSRKAVSPYRFGNDIAKEVAKKTILGATHYQPQQEEKILDLTQKTRTEKLL